MKQWNEECAVVGTYNLQDSALLSYYALFALQHRGQEASGISTSNGKTLQTIKGNGLVTKVFDEKNLKKLMGNASIGHNRYSTAGKESMKDSQPLFARYNLGELAVVHNGNLTNAKDLRQNLIAKGAIFQSYLDTENLIHLIAQNKKESLQDRILDALQAIDGAYALVFLSRSKMFAVRDRYGLRPLCLGKITNPNGSIGYMVASESCAFDLIGAEYIREIAPGEMIIFEGMQDQTAQIKSLQVFEPKPHPCIFELVYFARPDSHIFGKNVYSMRKNMGTELAKEHKIPADMVIPVPDSGLPAALGYSKESGIAFELGIIRNHYVGRTFIEPTQSIREFKVKLKLNPISSIIAGKDLIVIDDSVVRGTTSRQIIKILRQAGAKKIHLLISSPQIISPCYYGVDTPDVKDLICAQHPLEKVRDFIGADTLGFLSLKGLARSVGAEDLSYCQACFDQNYVDDFTRAKKD
ncbi:amidophosphoribosyltransferase [Helicobacter mustelae]|uniref:Amidophosphoribosyltransferase n=1 Tax=Helicobacter mustelae (strain ATCC 43772 / CCUG 25715 / CIP 103759 / LMG 18044 / NCTC 12198 / R85-136P) TaxID=679897 RepID=D3UI56_HELM1|nr:amidophosphoribosyltransferase [Helicobacter mustelae]CBG40179.1 amidophosphoribosyltransferase [Helicobacter mustelae 12198]SQH71682.1 amidophosphoribosyltransferase [Helicobacter mustelae]